MPEGRGWGPPALARVKDGTPGSDGVPRAYLIHGQLGRACREAIAAAHGLPPGDYRNFVRT